MLARLALAAVTVIGTGVVGVVPLVTAAPSTADVSPTTLPPSAPGRLAYSTATYFSSDSNGGVMVVHGLGTIGLDGSDQRTLTDPSAAAPGTYAGYDHSPQWSPDGDWLAYLQNRPGPVSGTAIAVAVIPRDGGDPQIIDAHGYGPAWSPDGLHLAWVSLADDGSHSIGIADVQTTPATITITNQRTLQLPDPTTDVARPTFSADGQTLALVTGHFSNYNGVLSTISISGGDLIQVSHDVGVLDVNSNYGFSPDGTKLLFLAKYPDNPGRFYAFVVDSDGTNQHQVGPGSTDHAAWAPGGDEIAMTASTQGLYLVDVDGNYLGQLAQGEFSYWSGLTFSPDGSHIYSVASPVDSQQWAPDLYAIPVNGDAPQRLTTDHSVFPSTVQAIDPGRVLRQFGDSAAATAAAAVYDNLDAVDTLVVSPVDDYAATLTAAPLAAQLGAPALVTPTDTLSRHVVEAAHRMHASHVVLVGGLSSNVADALRAAGLTVSRVGNTTSPYRVSAAVASQLTSHQAFVVPLGVERAGDWKLPLATAGLAAFKRKAMLYATHVSVPPATSRAIRDLDITTVTVIGDDKDVSPRLLHQLSQLGVTVNRVRSSDRYAISALLAQRGLDAGARPDHPIVASGTGWASSVTAPALAALLRQVAVLVDQRSLANSKPTASWLGQHRRLILAAKLIGGVHVMWPRVEAQLEGRV